MVMPIRTYRALWIIELSTLRPLNSPPAPRCVEFPPLEELVPAGPSVTSCAADTSRHQSGTRAAGTSPAEVMSTSTSGRRQTGELDFYTGAGAEEPERRNRRGGTGEEPERSRRGTGEEEPERIRGFQVHVAELFVDRN